ncbi:hypothetical protein FSST1_012555 [Fusarium sambucinum]
MAHLVSRRTRLVLANGYLINSICQQRLNLSRYHYSKMLTFTHTSGIDAEPVERYKPGGYHPITLYETLKDDRYKVLHELGYGGYSTTWAAMDQKTNSYVAVKVIVADPPVTTELNVLEAVSALPKTHPGSCHIIQLLDHFTVDGPNGSHECLVMEIAGPNVQDSLGAYRYNGLPATLAKVVAKQVLQGLDFLAVYGIAHGDLHTKNIVLALPDLSSLSEKDFVARLGEIATGAVTRIDGRPLEDNFPNQIIRPASFRGFDNILSRPSVKIIDFGQAFLGNNAPTTLQNPVYLQPPEVVFGDLLDRRVDLWSAGCLIFELITGQPPFDTLGQTPPLLVEQMLEELSEELPSRWQAKWEVMHKELVERRANRKSTPEDDVEDEIFTLHEWLEECYYFDDKKPGFTKEELASMAEEIGSMMRFEPSLRATPADVLAHDMFREKISS